MKVRDKWSVINCSVGENVEAVGQKGRRRSPSGGSSTCHENLQA